jgi:hypothetical protein
VPGAVGSDPGPRSGGRTIGNVGAAAALALVLAAPPPDDALQAFQKSLRALEVREAAWWKEQPLLEDRWTHTFHGPLRQQYAEKVTEPHADFAPVRKCYGELLALEDERAELYRALGASGHAKSLATLWKESLAAADLEAKAERDNLPGELATVGFTFRQGPSIRIHGLARRKEGLAKAFAANAGAAAFLSSPGTWKEACDRDQAARSPARRAFLVDALAALPEGAGRVRLDALLADEAPEVRIAAVEGLAAGPWGPPPSMAPLLEDPAPVVRLALLDALRVHPPKHPAWIEPLARAHLDGKGRVRADALRVLRAASGRDLGDDPAAWKAWLAETEAARKDGTWKPAPGAPDAAASKPAPSSAAKFWGIPVDSRRVLVAADGWSTLVVPADHSFQVTRHVTDWVTGQRGWRKDREAIQDVVARLLPPFLGALGPDASFRVLLAAHPSNKIGDFTWFDEKGSLPATRGNAARAGEFVEGYHIGATEAFHLVVQAILETKEPDTAVLVTGGLLRTDRFLLPEALVDEFRRRNRFRRIRLHVVHVMDHGPENLGMLESLARASGGTYVRSLVPPPR